jgi:predicted Zn-dependent protease
LSAYTRAQELSVEYYPAVLGQVRVLHSLGQKQEALKLLQDLLIQFPDNKVIKEQLARTYYAEGDWSRAESALAELLQHEEANPSLLLLYAHTLVEQGQFFKALPWLDRYGALDGTNRLYLLLRARIQYEGYHNRDAALTYLRALLKADPADVEAAVYTAELLLGSSREEEYGQGRELLQTLLQTEAPALSVLDLVFRDAVQREDWEAARPFTARLLEADRSRYLLDAAKVEQGIGNTQAAFAYAQEWHDRHPADQEGALVYISILIDLGQRDSARRLIESHLPLSERTVKAEYYYLRSRMARTEAAALQDLRSSLFEDPRNLHALMGMVEYYRHHQDEQRLRYYLDQIPNLAPVKPSASVEAPAKRGPY